MDKIRIFLNSSHIKKNIDWLLTNSSAPIKYLTHKNLLGTKASTRVMRSLWCDVENSPCVREIFGKQEKDGSWYAGGSWAYNPTYALKGRIDPYSPKYVTTVWILPLLGEMGYSAKDKRILKACHYAISHGYFQNPIFGNQKIKLNQSIIDICPCRFAQYMAALGAVNFVDDIKVEKGYEILLCMQGDDGGWVDPRHFEQRGWTRSCPYSTYHAVMALYYSNNPAYREALIKGAEFLLWHLSTKKDSDLKQFFYHGHSIIRELVMFSDLGMGLQTKAVDTILKWLMTMYDAREGCFKFKGKPISQYSKKEDSIDSRVAKYRFYHLIENDWLTYHMTSIAINMTKHETIKRAG